MAKDVRPLPLAVDRRGLDDQLDLGQIAAPSAAGLPVHAAVVPYPLWRKVQKMRTRTESRARISKYAKPGEREGVCTRTYTFTQSPHAAPTDDVDYDDFGLQKP